MAEVGSIGAGDVHEVSPNGQIGSLGFPPMLHWGVRADDRWHIAKDERAIRQGIAGDEVSVETRLRVPGGDIVHRANSTTYKNSSVVIVEIENQTPLPVALALFITGEGSWKYEGNILARNQIPVLSASNPISNFLVASSQVDLHDLVKLEENQTGKERFAATEGSHVATIFPLPHTSTLRFAFRSGTAHDSLPSPVDLPSLEGIANGWNVHLNHGSTVSFEDERLERVLFSARRHLLVGSQQGLNSPYWRKGVPPFTPAIAAVSMCLWGHSDASKHLLIRLLEDTQMSAFQPPESEDISYLLWACNQFISLYENTEASEPILARAVEQIGNLIRSIPRWRIRRRADYSFLRLGLESSIRILRVAGKSEEVLQLEAALPKIYRKNFMTARDDSLPKALLNKSQSADPLFRYLSAYLGGTQSSGALDKSIAMSETTGSFSSAERLQDPFASAIFLLALRRYLVGQPIRNSPTVALFPSYNSKWFNTSLEVSNMPIANGEIGYAVRWHGDRPALLWEGTTNSQVHYIAPGLDPDWENSENRGEWLFPKQEPQETAIPLISPPILKLTPQPIESEAEDNFS